MRGHGLVRRVRIAIGMWIMRVGVWVADPPRFTYDGRFNIVVSKRNGSRRPDGVTK